MITRERLKELFSYNPDNGEFRRIKGTRGVSANRKVGSENKGYLRVRIDGSLYYLHRLAFLYMGFDCDEVDHIDGNKKNNSWCNLRSSTRVVNTRNSEKSHLNKNGIQGIKAKGNGKFQASISGKYIGTFDNIFDAACARISMENKMGYRYTLRLDRRHQKNLCDIPSK